MSLNVFNMLSISLLVILGGAAAIAALVGLAVCLAQWRSESRRA